MKFVCTHNRVVEVGKYWCHNCDHGCPANQLSAIFDAGEKFDAFEIKQIMRIFATCVLYRAQRGKETVLIKIAHRGYEDALKRESKMLSQFPVDAGVPILLPGVEQSPYSKFTIRDETKYYAIYRNVPGKFLDDMLWDNARPERKFAGWLILGVTETVSRLHVQGKATPINPTPSNIMVQIDKKGIGRTTLVDMTSAFLPPDWPRTFGVPAYLTPEQLRGEPASSTTDVYALGLLLYELLTGQPAYSVKAQQDSEVRAMVLNSPPPVLNLPELSPKLVNLVAHSISKNPAQRPPNVREFAKTLHELFGVVPPPGRRLVIDPRIVIVAVLIVIVLLLVMVVLLSAQTS